MGVLVKLHLIADLLELSLELADSQGFLLDYGVHTEQLLRVVLFQGFHLALQLTNQSLLGLYRLR